MRSIYVLFLLNYLNFVMQAFLQQRMVFCNERYLCQVSKNHIKEHGDKYHRNAYFNKPKPAVVLHGARGNHQIKVKPVAYQNDNSNNFQKYPMPFRFSCHKEQERKDKV